MSENLVSALWITALGMGLVFAAIILLWGVMAALMRFTSGKSQDELEEVKTQTEIEQKRRAAIAAVTIALARQADSMEPHEFPLPSTALVSAWQAVMRTKMISKRGFTK